MEKAILLKKESYNDHQDLIFIQDADLEYNPKDFLKLIYVFENYDADVAYGSRFKHSDISCSFTFAFNQKLYINFVIKYFYRFKFNRYGNRNESF